MAAEPAGGLWLAAPAKINLFLHVIGRRADGYHDLESLFVFTRLGDRLWAEPAPDIRLSITGPFGGSLSAGPDNIVLRAAKRLGQVTGCRQGVHFMLEKRLPVASGIGGGSSDAAAALRLLDRLWGLRLPPGDIASIALSLGADVPACLAGRPVLVRGIGERIEAVPSLPDLQMVLVNPGVPLATADVFRRRLGPFGPPGTGGIEPGQKPFASASDLASALMRCRNDLEPAAIALVPAVGVALRHLGAAPGCLLARMSGSGATCFGLFSEPAAARSAAGAIRAAQPGWWVAVTAPRAARPRPGR
ncbi:MAG: 4-(cytidine 5'-diphospho)-2-C-methyl-D-erythritol kinase [Alphaproteobacteria bacterium]